MALQAMAEAQPPLETHVEDSVEDLARLHREHAREASPLQRGIDAVTGHLSRPAVALAVIFGLLAWAAAVRIVAGADPSGPGFVWLELTATFLALAVALLILVTQRREDQLAERRSQLALELALLADKKTAKVIALLEEMRRDAPMLADRSDAESEAMAKPADAEAVMKAIDERT